MKQRKEKIQKFWKRLHLPYRLSIKDGHTLSEVARLQASKFSVAMVVLVFAVALVTITAILIISTPIRNYLPGYSGNEVRRMVLQKALVIDSLEQKVHQQEVYLNNLYAALTGRVSIDSVRTDSALLVSADDEILAQSEAEKNFTESYQQAERYNLSAGMQTEPDAESVVMLPPMKGVVSQKFNVSAKRFGLEISAPEKETVVAAMEGVVTFTGFDPENSYFIQIQHSNGIVAIYKNAGLLLRKAGDKVRTGEAVAIVAPSKNKKGIYSLQFELWDKGKALNPETYISF